MTANQVEWSKEMSQELGRTDGMAYASACATLTAQSWHREKLSNTRTTLDSVLPSSDDQHCSRVNHSIGTSSDSGWYLILWPVKVVVH